MDTVYLESSIISYLRKRPSGDVINVARQLLTARWWAEERTAYDPVISQYVIDEIAAGDPELAAERVAAVEGIPLLPPAPEIPRIAAAIMARAILPPKAQCGRVAHRGRGAPSDKLPADVELFAYRKCENSAENPRAAAGDAAAVARDLHPRGVPQR